MTQLHPLFLEVFNGFSVALTGKPLQRTDDDLDQDDDQKGYVVGDQYVDTSEDTDPDFAYDQKKERSHYE